MKLSKEQIQEWIESPVTEYLASLIKENLDHIDNFGVTDVIVDGEPIKTQEALIRLHERRMAWRETHAYLTEEWEAEEDSDE